MLSIAREGKGPLALPIWYLYRDGEVILSMNGTSLKADLLRKRGRATLTAQQESPPYQYVMVEGPVTVNHEDLDVAELAIHYLGPEMGGLVRKEQSAECGVSRGPAPPGAVAGLSTTAR